MNRGRGSSDDDDTLVTLEPGFGYLPVVVGEDVVTVDGYRESIIVETVDKIKPFYNEERE